MWLYYWEKYGYQHAESIFCRDYIRDKGHLVKGKPSLFNVLDGKLEFLKMVKGPEDPTFLKLRERFEILVEGQDSISLILKEWETNGIDKAIELYMNKVRQTNG